MAIYCPTCLANSLKLKKHGIVSIIINGKQKDNGRFLYNRDKETNEEIIKNFTKKLEEFFQWYSAFKNQDPIKYVQIISNDFSCSNDCSLPLHFSDTVIGLLIPAKQIILKLKELGDKYSMVIELEG